MKRVVSALVLSCAVARAEGWVVHHQPDRLGDHVLMEAWADADHGPARLELYCDADNGFRVMFLPRRALLDEGPARIALRMDATKEVVLEGQAFGDDQTDVVTVLDTARIQEQVAKAHRLTVHYQGAAGLAGEDTFTLGDLSAQNALMMQFCPMKHP